MTETTPPPNAPADELRTLLSLALPLMASQVGMMLLGVVETLIVGRAGTSALAAASLGNVWSQGTLFMAMGVVMGADPLLSQAFGAKDHRGAALTFQRGIVLAVLLGLPLSILWLFTAPVMGLFGQDPGLAKLAGTFVAVQAPTAFGFLLFTITRQYLSSQGLVSPALWVVLAVNVANVGITYGLVFGGHGLPALGLLGAGLSGGIARLLLPAGLLLATFGFGLHRRAWLPWGKEAFSARHVGRIARLGFPLGVQFGLEVWAFQIATLLAGRLGEVPLSAHGIVLNLASFSFMFPLGISTAASVRVGNLIGAGDTRGACRAARLSLALGVGVMGFFGAVFFLLRFQLPKLYGAEPDVALACAKVLPIAAAFQILDGIQVVASGILRGLGRTKPAAILNLGGYYGLALPLAYALGLRRGAGLEGVWWGLSAGLFFVALGSFALVWRPSAYGVTRTGI